MMRKFLYMTLALVGLMFAGTGCNSDEKTATLVEGSWHYASDEVDIYVSFASSGDFCLYQKLGEGRHYLYNGTWLLEDNILSGKYNDGTPWGSAYEVSFEGDNKMTLTATNGSSERNTYTRTTIPEEVLEESVCKVRGGAVEEEIPTPVF